MATAMSTALSDSTWIDVERLYADLRAAEARTPGSPDATDLELAIDRLLDAKHENDSPAYRRANAVRRARYGRRRAAQQRADAAVRLAPPPAVRTGKHLRRPDAPTDAAAPDDTEQAVVAADALLRAAADADRVLHGRAVLAGLLDDRPAHEIAASAGISRRSVVRCVSELRRHAAAVAA